MKNQSSRFQPRRTSFLAGLLLCGLWSAPVFADDPLGNPTTAQELCEQIQAAKAQIKKTSPLELLFELLRVRFVPGTVSRPVYDVISTSPAQRLALPQGALPEGRNLIFSLEPFQELRGGAQASAAKRRYAELESELTTMRGRFRTFVQAPSVEECVARIKSTGFDFNHLTQISTEMNSISWVGQIRDAHAANRIVSRKLRRLRLHWEYFPASDLATVFNALRSPQVRNVILIAHSLSDGNLVDSSFNEYPNRFFASDLSPTLESLSVFTCHGDQVLKRYGLDEVMRTIPTYYSRRGLFTARGADLAGQSDVVPMNALDNFIARVDRWLAYSPQGTVVVSHLEKPYCAIELTGLQARQGGYAFLLNGDFVGALDANIMGDGAPVRLDFPCALERAKNVLILRSTAVVVNSDIVSTDAFHGAIHGTILRPGQAAQELPEGTHYRRDDGTYQSSKWVFSK